MTHRDARQVVRQTECEVICEECGLDVKHADFIMQLSTQPNPIDAEQTAIEAGEFFGCRDAMLCTFYKYADYLKRS